MSLKDLFKKKDPEQVQTRYAQMCARLGDVEFQIYRFETARESLLDEIKKAKADYDKCIKSNKAGVTK